MKDPFIPARMSPTTKYPKERLLSIIPKKMICWVVAKGYAQEYGIHFFETFAPVARLSSLRLMVSLAAKLNLRINQLDIETAYLNGKMDTEVLIEQPELLDKMLRRMTMDPDPKISQRAEKMLNQLNRKTTVCKLNRAIYGLRQAGRQ